VHYGKVLQFANATPAETSCNIDGHPQNNTHTLQHLGENKNDKSNKLTTDVSLKAQSFESLPVATTAPINISTLQNELQTNLFLTLQTQHQIHKMQEAKLCLILPPTKHLILLTNNSTQRAPP
jgi:hypothetical protein